MKRGGEASTYNVQQRRERSKASDFGDDSLAQDL